MISFVIPVVNEKTALTTLIPYLRRHSPDSEIILSDGGSTDGSRQLGRRLGARVFQAPVASRGVQLNLGAEQAEGDILCFLHADVLPPVNSEDLIRSALKDSRTVGGGFQIQFDVRHPALTFLNSLSSIAWHRAYLGDQGFFCLREAFRLAGGYPPWPLFEDVGLAANLARIGRLQRLRGATLSSSRRFEKNGPWCQLSLNTMLWVLFHLGASPGVLHRLYGSIEPPCAPRPHTERPVVPVAPSLSKE